MSHIPLSHPQTIHQVRVGQYVNGYVHNVQDFGAFVDFGRETWSFAQQKVPDTERGKIKSGVRLNVFVISCEIRNGRARIGLSFFTISRDRRSHSRSRDEGVELKASHDKWGVLNHLYWECRVKIPLLSPEECLSGSVQKVLVWTVACTKTYNPV